MNSANLTFAGASLTALPSGALCWPDQQLLVVSDLHLGKSERLARRGGQMLPPYETMETLTRVSSDIAECGPSMVICLGDSFDDLDAALSLDDAHRETIQRLQAGRRWIWIEGNHDPGPIDFGGEHRTEFRLERLVFRHSAEHPGEIGEISGHYHPKARVRGIARRCFMMDEQRLILPAYGAYTGGLDWTTPALRNLFGDHAMAYLTGRKVLPVPVPRAA